MKKRTLWTNDFDYIDEYADNNIVNEIMESVYGETIKK